MRLHDEIASLWAARLGLASESLFGDERRPGRETHHVLLDGAMGSFALSTSDIDETSALNWTWSAHLRHHVQVAHEKVVVRHLGSGKPPRSFTLGRVSERLDTFLGLLTAEPSRPAVDVIGHVMGLFRAHRSICRQAHLDDGLTLRSFMALLDPKASGQRDDAIMAILKLRPDYIERFNHDLNFNRVAGRSLELALLLRHASGDLFQEAHSELTKESPQAELFGLPIIQASGGDTDAVGAFYTPPALARLVSEAACRGLDGSRDLTILDPACGSGSFLIQAAHALRRMGHAGRISLRGYDVSPFAVEMARFAIERANIGGGTIEADIQQADFLHADVEDASADAVVMNPPFCAFGALSEHDRESVRSVLGDAMRYRPDFSQAFVTKALRAVKDGGRLGSVVPVGILASEFGKPWRASIAQDAAVELIALIGAYDIFKNATVSVACLVLKRPPAQRPIVTMVWAKPKPMAASSAMRAIRHWSAAIPSEIGADDWTSYSKAADSPRLEQSWLPTPNALDDRFIAKVRADVSTTVSDLFSVELGIRAGDRSKFVVPDEIYQRFGDEEKTAFRPIAEKDGIRNGRILVRSWLYYPVEQVTVSQARTALPTYYKLVLAPMKLPPGEKLMLARARRRTMSKALPCIVSRSFADVGAFAVDETGENVVVQGFSWRPTSRVARSKSDLATMLHDYSFIFNSRIFMTFAQEFSVNQAGGQIEMRRSFMKDIPLPNLIERYRTRPDIGWMAARLREIESKEFPTLQDLNAFSLEAYGIDEDEWPASTVG